MERITIEMADDGRITVTAESPGEEVETMEVDSVNDAAELVGNLLMDAQDEAGAAEPEADPAAMWNEEAAKRPPQPNMMA